MAALGIAEGLMGLLGWIQQQGLDAEANKQTEGLYQQVLAELGGANQAGGLYGRVMPEAKRMAREGRMSGERQLGQVDRAFTAQQGRAHSDLVSRGLTGTTILPGVRAGIEGQRQYARSGVQDQVNRYNLGLDQYVQGLDQSLTGQRMATIASKNVSPGTASLSQLAQIIGSWNPPKVDTPKDNSLLGAGITGAAGVGGMALGAKILVLTCIDGDSRIVTTTGTRPLRDVQIGDMAAAADGSFRQVIRKDYGAPWPERHNDYVRINKHGDTMVCTTDHVVDGVPAGDWECAKPVHAVPSGDILLEGGEDYLVESLTVTSMFAAQHQEA